MARQYEWTISIIVQQDGEHLFEYVELEQSILDQKFNKSIRYIIFYYEQWSGRNCIKQLEHNPVTNQNQFDKLRDWVTDDLYDPQTLTGFFNQFVLKNAVSNHHMIFLWGHGAGMSYFTAKKNEPDKADFLSGREEEFEFFSAEQKKSFNDDLNELVFFQANFSYPVFDNMIFDPLMNFINQKYQLDQMPQLKQSSAVSIVKRLISDRLKAISIKTFASIIEACFTKVDVLITLNCYTQCMETAFQLRRKIEMLVAPQTTMAFGGWDYRKMFEYLAANTYEPKCLAENMRDNFSKKYTTEPFASQFIQRWPLFRTDVVSFSGILLSYIEDLAKTTSQMAIFFEKSLKTLFLGPNVFGIQIVHRSRLVCADVTPTRNFELIDATHFLGNCVFHIDDETSPATILYGQFEALKSKCCVGHLQVPKLFKPAGSPIPSSSPHFLSIFFPFKEGAQRTFAMYILNNFYTSTAKDACEFLAYDWDEFIKAV